MDTHVLDSLRRSALDSRRILLTGPVDADGDSLGATLALGAVFRRFVDAEVVVVADVPARYSWMQGAESVVPNESLEGVFDLVIVMDGDKDRLAPKVEQAFRESKTKAIVDHHRTTDPSGYDLAILDAGAAATCVQVLSIFDAWEERLTADIAELLYVGLLFDTGGFRYSNTKPGTHEAAGRLLATGFDHAAVAARVLMETSCAGMRLKGAILAEAEFHGDGQVVVGVCPKGLMERHGGQKGDLEGIVESLLYVEGVEISLLLVERGPNAVKLSFRSRGKVDVAELARGLTDQGGGHAKAAGAFMERSLGVLMETLPQHCVQALARAGHS